MFVLQTIRFVVLTSGFHGWHAAFISTVQKPLSVITMSLYRTRSNAPPFKYDFERPYSLIKNNVHH